MAGLSGQADNFSMKLFCLRTHTFAHAILQEKIFWENAPRAKEPLK